MAYMTSIRFAAWMLLAFSVDVFADGALRLYQDEQRQRESVELEQRLRQLRRHAPTQDVASKPVLQADEHCWKIPGVSVAGNQRIPDEAIARTVTPLTQACMGLSSINEILRALTLLYLERGYIGSRPYLRTAPTENEPLDILIIEGFVEAIELTDQQLPLSLSSAFPDLLGNPLQLRALEQGMDQLNRLRAFDLDAVIEPGELTGGSRVQISPRSRPPRASFSALMDDRGNEATGRQRFNLGVSFDSPTQLNDYLHLTATRSTASRDGYSQQQGAYYNVPYGPWLLGLNASQSRYRAPLPRGQLYNESRTRLYGLNLERTLWRNGRTLLSGNIRLSSKSISSGLGQRSLAVQRTQLTVAEMGVGGLWFVNGLWSASLSYAQGIAGLGADSAPATSRAPQPRFRKLRSTLGHSRSGQVAGQSWRLNSQLEIQYSPDPLPSLEHLLLTDHYAVRGFRQTSVSSSSGALWRNTISLPRPLPGGLALTPYLGLDLAHAVLDFDTEHQRLVGTTAGATLQWQGARLSLEHQRPLFNSRQKRLEPGFWSLEMALSF